MRPRSPNYWRDRALGVALVLGALGVLLAGGLVVVGVVHVVATDVLTAR